MYLATCSLSSSHFHETRKSPACCASGVSTQKSCLLALKHQQAIPQLWALLSKTKHMNNNTSHSTGSQWSIWLFLEHSVDLIAFLWPSVPTASPGKTYREKKHARSCNSLGIFFMILQSKYLPTSHEVGKLCNSLLCKWGAELSESPPHAQMRVEEQRVQVSFQQL